MWAGVSPFSPGADVGRRWGGPIVSAMTSSTESSVRQRFRNTPPITWEYPQYPYCVSTHSTPYSVVPVQRAPAVQEHAADHL
jgi:hypothetical protein